jgi:N-acyl-D-amino-acid deacylase
MPFASSQRFPAQREHLADRGVIKIGMWADLVVFDPNAIHDVATYDDPNRLSEGMSYVFVNGVPVIEQGKMTGALPGKVLRGPGFSSGNMVTGSGSAQN